MPYSSKSHLINAKIISIGARSSPLSQAQIQEVLAELRIYHPGVQFQIELISTSGDLDQKSSLRTMEKSDFFTKEIDAAVLSGRCRIGIHSAKDLPEPIPQGLSVICLTKGIDPSDSLVLRSGETWDTLPSGAIIATSSVRREEVIKSLRSDLRFIDLRGTIHQRLDKLLTGESDGVVVAEAALIRLKLTHLNRIKLPGATVPGQGQLAIVSRSEDVEMTQMFSCMHKGPK